MALNYNYFRDYDPATGRYIQSDPLGLNAGLSTYAYVRGNPLGAVDLKGLYDCTYSISALTMLCAPDKVGDPLFTSSDFVAGNDQNKDCPNCQNNPDKTSVSDSGPLPVNDYSIGRQRRGSSRRDLTPSDTSKMFDRFAMQIHGCSNTKTCSNGCIAATSNKVRDEFNSAMSLEEGRNTLHVVP